MPIAVSWAFLILRLVAGLTLAAHGAQKLLGWFGGSGYARLGQGFEKQGLKPAWLWSSLVIVGEVGGGLSVAFGFLTPLGAAGMVGAMFMAIFKTHWPNGFWNSKRGYEFPLLLLSVGVAIGVAGPGGYALDAFLKIGKIELLLFGVLAVAAILVDVAGLYISRPPAAAQSETPSRAT